MANPEQCHRVKAEGNPNYLTDLDVRIWLRDNDPSANLLLDDFEYTPEEIRTCMTLAVDYWNEQPPNLGNLTLEKFQYRSALLRGTCANLLFMAAHRFRRNDLKYQAGGMTIADQDKYQQYDAAGQRLWDEYKQWVMSNKRAINMENGWARVR